MMPWKGSHPIYLLVLLMGIYATHAGAVEGWKSYAGLSVKSTYSDNIDLDESGEDSDLNIRLAPSFGISKQGRFNRLSFDYSLSFQKYLESNTDDELRHNLTGRWNSELYRDVLFMDVRANAGQTLISNSGRYTGDDVNTTGNTTQTYTYSISPYTKHHFGQYADLLLRLSHDQVIYADSSSDDSSSQEAGFRLTSGRRFKRMGWSLNGSLRRVDQDSSGSDDYRRVKTEVSYELNREWRPFIYIGYEDNDYATNSDSPSGSTYGAGFTWTPGPRTKLRLNYGQRFYGDDWTFSLTHRQRQGQLTASYTRSISSSRDETLANQTFQRTGSLGTPIQTPALNQGTSINIGSPDLSNDVYLLDRLSLSYNRKIGRRDRLSLSVHHTKRDNQVSLNDETQWGFSANWSHVFAANLSGTVRASWETTEEVNQNDDHWDLGFMVSRRLSEKTSMAFDLRHTSNDSTSVGSDYSENRATLTLSTRW